VATDLGGFSELVDDGVDGRLVAHDDPDALAAALTPLVTDPAVAHAMGRAGRVKVDRGFSPAGHLDTLMTHYDEVAGDMRRAPRKAMR
jgi:glycosyltransferase involved in cell wall biosynthesis